MSGIGQVAFAFATAVIIWTQACATNCGDDYFENFKRIASGTYEVVSISDAPGHTAINLPDAATEALVMNEAQTVDVRIDRAGGTVTLTYDVGGKHYVDTLLMQ